MNRFTDKGKRLNWRSACKILGCGKTKFYDMVNTGALPAYRCSAGKRGLWVWEADCYALIKPVEPDSL
ncbi:DNA-binding protein [Oleidesulfovibrio sp.]|uniref:DNA-binding protein n=1 Tax=Oleidesulfovibrio sp. TaxID=2909707 RepID=UPI003A83CC12